MCTVESSVTCFSLLSQPFGKPTSQTLTSSHRGVLRDDATVIPHAWYYLRVAEPFRTDVCEEPA
jgi:hypothetical protein